MYITTNIGLRDYLRIGIIWHGSYHETLGKGGTLLVGNGIRRDMIGLPVPENTAAGIVALDNGRRHPFASKSSGLSAPTLVALWV